MSGDGLPSFVLVGVPRSGTTSLYRYFRQHPQLCLSEVKEVNFLSYPGAEAARRDVPWLRFPVTTIDRYRELFADAGDRVAVDFSASCYRSPVAIDRIRQFVPDAGLFVLLRDPVARAYSAYLNRLNKGYEDRPPEAALVRGEAAVDNGFYAERLAAFRDAFGPDRVRVWLFDDLSARPQETLAEMFAHFGVDPSVPIDTTAVYNRGGVARNSAMQRLLPSYPARRRLAAALPGPVRTVAQRAVQRSRTTPPPIPEAVAERLRATYAEDVRALGQLLGRDLGSWTAS
jgi:hypothetical protein